MKCVTIKNLVIGEGKPKICVPVVGRTMEEMEEAALHISRRRLKPDLTEVRVDWFSDVFCTKRVEELLKRIRARLPEMPLLVTFRTAKEGGEQSITLEQYESLLLDVAERGLADAVDVEAFSFGTDMERLMAQLKNKGVTVIASNHDFEKTPDRQELVRRLYRMRDMGADIAKVAVMPVGTEDVLTLLSATLQAGEDEDMCPVITMSMGGNGVISRLSGEIFRSALTFASVGTASAPGQIPLEELVLVLDTVHDSLKGEE